MAKAQDEPSESSIAKSGPHIWTTSVARVLVAGLILAACLRFVPESYAVCSKAGNIYTVDRNNPQVECISVRGSRIVGVGSFGTYYGLPHLLEAHFPNADDIQRLHYPKFISPVLSNRLARSLIPTSRVIQVNDDAIVVPGLAGENPCHFHSCSWIIELEQMLMHTLLKTAMWHRCLSPGVNLCKVLPTFS